MKKRFIIVCAICVLFLSACGSLAGTNITTSNSAAHSAAPVVKTSTQSVCQVLQDRQTLLKQEYQVASTQLASAQTQGNRQQVGEAEKTLRRLHQSLDRVQAQLKAC